METELTKIIKKLTHTYRPKMGNRTKAGDAGRTIRWADEVWTPRGIVDSIRFEDYIVSRHENCKKERNGESCKMEGCTHPNPNCRGCIYLHRDDPVIGMMITAFEVKISKADFKSKNGHNIDNPGSPIANENYYCVPKELIGDIEPLVPEHCGILAYTGNGLREYRKPAWLNVPDETKIMLLYNSLKKWVDGNLN